MPQTLNLAILLSGSGRSLENFHQLIKEGRLTARIAVVVSSKANAYGLQRARQYGLDAVAVPRRDYDSLEAFNDAINDVLSRYDIDLVVLV
jgi:phosphoribosylglycinamide formyltransferase-1